MNMTKKQTELVAEAWERFGRAMERAKGIADKDGSAFISLWDVECAVDDLRDEMIQAGIPLQWPA